MSHKGFFVFKSLCFLLINNSWAVIISGNISGMLLQFTIRLQLESPPYMEMWVARAIGLGIFGLNRGKQTLAGE
jgi:hypothetical protein